MTTLFQPLKLGTMTIPNRLVRSATWEGLADEAGNVTSKALVDIYRALADGGVGLIISSYMHVRPDGRQQSTQIGVERDDQVEGLRKLADAVHAGGGKIAAQIVHCGGQASRAAIDGQTPVAPSAVASPGYPEVPRALEATEIDGIIASFADAARRVKAAGFDGVQLHGAHGYLLAQFLSPLRNRRQDRYGGSVENRARFCLEVLGAVRATVGEDFPVLIKLNAHDFLDGSTTEQDSSYLARRLADAGIDAIEVSGGTPGSGKLGAARIKIEAPEDEAYFRPQARAIREAASGVPLILVGGIRSPTKIEELLASGEVDALAMSRPLIREPGLPARWQRGDLRRAACVSCSRCFGPARKGEGIRCVSQTGQ